MSDEKLLQILKECPKTENKYSTYYIYDTVYPSDPYKFYYNKEKTTICLDMNGVDLHIITKKKFRKKGYARKLLEEFVIPKMNKNSKITNPDLSLENLLIRNNYKKIDEYTFEKQEEQKWQL